jgi:hypothetical protein
MATYLVPSQVESVEVRVRKAPIVLMIDFDLPESVRETMPNEEFCRVQGKRDMSCYIEPQQGDVLVVEGHIWQVTGRMIYPYPHGGKGDRVIPVVAVEYIGRADEELYP